MFGQDQANDKDKGRWLPSALAAVVFGIGLAAALVVDGQRVEHEQRRLAAENVEAARQYAFLAQRQLDAYAATGLSLAAYISTSATVDNASVNAFVRSAHVFEQLRGVRAYGYLPRVAPELAGELERAVQPELPGYRIRNKPPGAEFHYPVLYLSDPDPQRVAIVRGLDYAAFPERLQAIRKAEASGMPTATSVHASVRELAKNKVILTFTPLRTAERRYDRGTGAGVVFSVMRVSELFEGIGGGLTRAFTLAIHESDGSRKLVYQSVDPVRDAPGPTVYSTVLHYADRSWRLDVLSRTPPAPAAAHDRSFLASSALGSLIAAYAVHALARRLRARRLRAALAQRFEALLDAHPFAVYAADRSGRFVFANHKMQQELGLDRAQLAGLPSTHFLNAECKDAADTAFRRALGGEALAYQASLRNNRNQLLELAVVLVPILVGGEVDRVLGFAENVTERKSVERELFESRQMLRLILDTIPDRVFWKDLESRFLGANRHMAEAAGLASAESIAGLSDADMPWAGAADAYQDEDRDVMASGVGRLNMERQQQTADGDVRWFDVSKLPLTQDDGTVTGLLGVARDITRYKQMEQELIKRANHDSLTGLPNRTYFHSALSQALARATRRHSGLALMYFDIDHFKQINDVHGHDVGDDVIRLFADRVCANLRASDFVARLGGDEFVLIVEALDDTMAPHLLASKLVAAMAAPLRIRDLVLQISTSIGIALFDGAMTADQLVKAADNAMYEAKRAGRNCFRSACAAR